MKTKVFTLFVLFTLSTVSIIKSQVISDYGLKFGMISSQMNVKINPYSIYVGFPSYKFYDDNRLSGTFGVFLNMFKTKYFDLQNEIKYIQEGAEDKVSVTTAQSPEGIDELSWDHEYNFIRYSLNLRPYYQIKNNNNIYLILGPSVNYLIKNRDDFYLHEDLKDFYYGYNLGFGFTTSGIIDKPLLLEFKYNGYFNHLADNSEIKADIKSWQINIGVALK